MGFFVLQSFTYNHMVLNFVWLPYTHSGISYSMLREHDSEIEQTKRITSYVREAIERTKEQIPEHWNTTLDNRTEENSIGSYYKMTSEELEDTLLNSCNFKMFQHDDISSVCQGFITYDLLGHTGLVELKDLPPNFLIKLENNKGNFLSCVAELDNFNLFQDFNLPTEPTVLILGIHNDETVVFTFHAGNPVTPSKLTGEDRIITVKEARSMGFDYARLRRIEGLEEE